MQRLLTPIVTSLLLVGLAAAPPAAQAVDPIKSALVTGADRLADLQISSTGGFETSTTSTEENTEYTSEVLQALKAVR